MAEHIIDRPTYTSRISKMFGRGLIIALTGQRRVGKSFLMKKVIQDLETDVSNHIVYLNLEKEGLGFLNNHQILNNLHGVFDLLNINK